MYNAESLLEIAIKLLQNKKKPKKFKEIIREVMTKKGYTVEESKEYTPQFMLDFMASGYFVYCGDDTWDLKDRQPVAMLDKDGGDFEYSSDDLDEVKANELKDDDYEEQSNDNSQLDDDDDDDDDDEDDISKEFSDDDEDEFDRVFDSDEDEFSEE